MGPKVSWWLHSAALPLRACLRLPQAPGKWYRQLPSARCLFSGVKQKRGYKKLTGFSLSLSLLWLPSCFERHETTLHPLSPSPAQKAERAKTQSRIIPWQYSLLTLPLRWELLAALSFFLRRLNLPVPSVVSGTLLSLAVGSTAPKPEAQSCLQNVTTENTDQEKAKKSFLWKGEEKKLPLSVTHRPEGTDPPRTSNEAHLIILLSWDLSQPFLRV